VTGCKRPGELGEDRAPNETFLIVHGVLIIKYSGNHQKVPTGNGLKKYDVPSWFTTPPKGTPETVGYRAGSIQSLLVKRHGKSCKEPKKLVSKQYRKQ